MKLLLTLAFCAAALNAATSLHIPVEKYQLKNGMKVILSQDNSVPVVTIYVIFNVGARSEEKGRTGFAHLFEHMMFEGSANAPKGTHNKLVASNGGVLNGSTHPDFTDYYEVLPSNKLVVGLWLEADRMRSLVIDKDHLANQKEAVKQERRLSFDNQPYATAIVDNWPGLVFSNFSSSHSLIGSYEDLNAATVEDVSRFFKTFYAPNNAVMVIVGDIQPAEAKKLIASYFEDIPPQPQPQHPDRTEPERTEPKSSLYKDPLAKVPAVVIGYPGPARRTSDYYALAMIDALITGGESSRFQQDLVKEKQSVIGFEANLGWPFASSQDYQEPGIYGMLLMHNPRYTGKQIAGQVQDELARLQTETVSETELNRVRSFVRASRVKQMQNTYNRATLLGQYETFDHDPNLINTELDNLLSVTPAQIQAAARKYFVAGKRTVLEIVPGPADAKAGGPEASKQ